MFLCHCDEYSLCCYTYVWWIQLAWLQMILIIFTRLNCGRCLPWEADKYGWQCWCDGGGEGVRGWGTGGASRLPPSFLRTTVVFDERCWIVAGLHADTWGRRTTDQPGLLSKPTTCLLNLLTRPLTRGQGSRLALLRLLFLFLSFVSSPAASSRSLAVP